MIARAIVTAFICLPAISILCSALEMTKDQTLNDGISNKHGTIAGNPYGLGWTASGILVHNGSPKFHIKDCFTMELSSDPKKHLDANHLDTPRQRIELPAPHAGNGESFTYTWKYHLDSETKGGKNFFHIWQLLQRPKNGHGGPAITFDVIGEKVIIKDELCPDGKCPSIPLSEITNRTVLHTMNVTFGPKGKIDYKLTEVTDAGQGKELLHYARHDGAVGHDEVNLQFGTYRKAYEGMSPSLAYTGDFTSKKH